MNKSNAKLLDSALKQKARVSETVELQIATLRDEFNAMSMNEINALKLELQLMTEGSSPMVQRLAALGFCVALAADVEQRVDKVLGENNVG